jgi:hypothetical protein
MFRVILPNAEKLSKLVPGAPEPEQMVKQTQQAISIKKERENK